MAICLSLFTACPLAADAAVNEASGAGQTEAMEEYALDDIVVTASRVEEDLSKAQINISVITRKELEERHYDSVSEAIRDIPGVQVQAYGNGGANYSSTRIYLSGTDRVAVLVDGERVNLIANGMASADLPTFVSMDSIERIEVVKGSPSTLYGADAAGGVINIITRKSLQKEGMKTKLGMDFGSFGRRQYNVSNAGRSPENITWRFNWQRNLSGNYSDGSGVTTVSNMFSDNFSINLAKAFTPNDVLSLDYTNYLLDYLQPQNGTNKPGIIRKGWKHNTRTALTLKNKVGKDFDNRLTVYHNGLNLDSAYNTTSRWMIKGETWGVSDQLTYRSDNHTVVGGFTWYQDHLKDYYSGGTQGLPGKKMSNRAFFIQDDWKFMPKWNVTYGVRVDTHSEYGSHTSPSITVGYEADNRTNFYASYKHFFVAPGFTYLYGRYGQSDNKPETGHTIELGTNFAFDDKTRGNFHVFWRNTDNLIAYSAAINKYTNFQKETARGFDISFKKQFSSHWIVGIGYTYFHGSPLSDTTNPNRDGYIAPSTWNINIGYEQKNFDASLIGRALIARQGRKVSTYVHPGSRTYMIVDFAANYRFMPDARLYFRVNNLFNHYYTDMIYNTDPDPIRNPGNWYAAPGRSFVLGVEYSF